MVWSVAEELHNSGFLGMVAAIGVPITIKLISTMFRKEMYVKLAAKLQCSLPLLPTTRHGKGPLSAKNNKVYMSMWSVLSWRNVFSSQINHIF